MKPMTTRRQALRVIGVAAGAVGAATTVSTPIASAEESSPPAASATRTDRRTLHGVGWRLRRPGTPPGSLAHPRTPRLPYGELVDDAGVRVGSLHGDVAPAALGSERLHHVRFDDGDLTAVGPEIPGAGAATFRVIGGTGRYAGASGSYHLDQKPAPHGGTAVLVLDLIIPETH